MIVPMKKAAIIMQQKDAAAAVEKLRAFGLVHVEHQKAPQSQDLNRLQDDRALAVQALGVLTQEEFCPKSGSAAARSIEGDWRLAARHIIDLNKRLDQLREYSKHLVGQVEAWEPWGDFEPQAIRDLAGKQIYIGLYALPKKELNGLPEDVAVKIIGSKAGMSYCAVISRVKKEIGHKELELPKLNLAQMHWRLAEDKKVIFQIAGQLCQQTAYRGALADILQNVDREIEFLQALGGMMDAGSLAVLAGYLPAEQERRLAEYASGERWGLQITEPADEDNVPVLLRNAKWVSLIQPVFQLMEVVPGYRELDLSPLFLLFLSLFFGMIIGDAGYGAVYFIVTFLAQLKFGRKMKDKKVFFLFYLFSSCAILWGSLTGTFFGQQWIIAKGFSAPVPLLNEAKFVMSFCFFLGAVQLSLAHAWQFLSKLPSFKALQDAGFICLLWAGFFLAKMFIVGDPFPFFGKWLIWAGVLLVIFFSNPQKNVFKGVAEGLGVLALGAMGNFGDVVSYIRLFAVGLAGVAVADAVNNLAMGAAGNILAQAAIVAVGHTINIVLGPISVLVHGVRLNVLEFSLLHGNVTWNGLAYKPLKD